MDLSLTELQSMLQEITRKFLLKSCPIQHVRQMETDELGYSPQLWQEIAKMGWLDVETNCKEMGFLELALVVEQMGVVLLPSPFINTVIGALAVMQFGSQEQKQIILPAIASGQMILTLAIYEPDLNLSEESMQTRAVKSDQGWLIFGEKLLVSDLQAADKVLCIARTENGVTVFVIDANDAHLKRKAIQSLSCDKQWDITFQSLAVNQADILGREGDGWNIARHMLRWGACLLSAYMSGAADRVVKMTSDYAKEREQFGKPISKFQAIQHKMVDMMVEVAGARLLVYEAAWQIGQRSNSDFTVAAAKAWSGAAFHRVAEEGMRVFASMGYAKECDMQLYYRRATVLKEMLGDTHYCRDRVATLLGI